MTLPSGSFAAAERELIERALASPDGNKVAAAALLRISRKKLYCENRKVRYLMTSPCNGFGSIQDQRASFVQPKKEVYKVEPELESNANMKIRMDQEC